VPAPAIRVAVRWILRGAGALAAIALLGAVAVWAIWIPSPREPPYELVAAWGGKGAGPGQFHDPAGIALTETEVFVSDSRNGRIQVFDHEGRFRRAFGRPGEAPGQLGRPMNVAIRGSALYVAEYFNDRIQIFDLDGTPRTTIGAPGSAPGRFDAPGGVAVAANGDLYVADFYNHRVQQLRADGRFVRQWGTTGESGIAAGTFGYPTDVALAPDGTLFVADGYNDRVQVFDADGAFLRKWGGPLAMNIPGPFNGWFATVTSVTVDARGDVFVADFYNHRIQKFSAGGTFLTSFGAEGDAPGELRYPIATAVAGNGEVFVVDYGNHRIQRWRPR